MTTLKIIITCWLQLVVACQLAAAVCDRDVTCPGRCQPVRDSEGCASCDCSAAVSCQGVTCADNQVCQLVQVQCIRAPCPPLPMCVAQTATSPAPTGSLALCSLPARTGSCSDAHIRYYFDTGERTCKQFNYTGCLGNDNNFLSFGDCMAVCGAFTASPTANKPGECPRVSPGTFGICLEACSNDADCSGNLKCCSNGCGHTCQTPAAVTEPRRDLSSVTPELSFEYCRLDADYGLGCKPDNETAWFFNRTSGACETFVFGGCLGNQNRFLSQSICHSVCVLRSTGHRRPTSPPLAPRTTGQQRTSTTATSQRSCPEVDCAGKNCSVGGFATDALGCALCICADPCEETPCPVNTVCVRISESSRGTLCVVDPASRSVENTVQTPSTSTRQPSAISTRSTSTVTETLDDQFRSCCIARGVATYCHKLCSQSGLLEDSTDADLFICHSSLRRIVACAVNGIDVTQCCASKGVTGDCLTVCSGDITRFPSNILKCRPYVNSIASCVLPTTTASPTTPASPTRRRCPSTLGCARGSCQYGLATDEAGCEICACHEPCRNVVCAEGSECTITRHTVCHLDMCRLVYRGQCTARCERLNCTDTRECPYGHVKNSTTGCDTCPCLEPCQNFTCAQGFICQVSRQTQCEGASCSSSYFPMCVVECPMIKCAMTEPCRYGFARTADGCQTCECFDPCQGVTCPADTQCQPSNVPLLIGENGNIRRVYTSSCIPTSSQSTPTTPAACRPVRCRMYCRYGWARDAITGCERCACHDPCDDVSCEEGEVCQPTQQGRTYVGRCAVQCPIVDCVWTDQCNYGFARNAYGCQTCDCFDPCQGVTCQPSSRCQPTYQNHTYVGICVRELSTPSFLPTVSSSSREERFRSCCMREVPNPICHRFCSYDSLLSNLNNPSFLVCLAHINSLIGCAVGGDDRTQCCASKGITGRCLNVCSGNVDSFPADLMDCQRHAYSFGSCYDILLPTGLPPNSQLSTPTFRSSRDERFRSCCAREVPNPVCHRLCSYDSLRSNLDRSLVVCLAHVYSLIGCAVDGDDRTQCCASKGITGRCLNICSGNVDNFPANLMDCQRHAYSFASCYDVHLPTGLLPAPKLSTPSVLPTGGISRWRDDRFRSCCKRKVPNPICHRLCSYDSLLSNLNDPSLLVCLAHINRLVECASGGDDRTQCCASKGVTGRCLGACSGDVDNFPANVMDCQRHAYSFAACYDVQLPTRLPLKPPCPPISTLCDLHCEHGWARNVYSGCLICDCNDPCKNVVCESNFRCEPMLRGDQHVGVCVVADSRIKGILKLYADFSIIDNEHKFKSEIEKQIIGIMQFHEYLFKITQLRRGSIIADFIVSAPANVSLDAAVDILQHWSEDIEVRYNGNEYNAELVEYKDTRPHGGKSGDDSSSKKFLLLAVLIPVMVPICIFIIVIVIVLACKMNKAERSLLSSGSRSSSVAGDDSVASNKGFDNTYCVSIEDSKTGGASEA